MFALLGGKARRDEPLSARTVYADGGEFRSQALDYVWNELSWQSQAADGREPPRLVAPGSSGTTQQRKSAPVPAIRTRGVAGVVDGGHRHEPSLVPVVPAAAGNRPQPFILDLGVPLQRSLSFLSGITHRVHYEDLAHEYSLGGPRLMYQAWTDHVRRICSLTPVPKYDLVLCWDLLNYLTPDLFEEFLRLLNAVVDHGTYLHLLLSQSKELPSRPGRYHILDRTTIRVEFAASTQCAGHQFNQLHLREILPHAKVCRSVLLRNGAHEHLVRID